MCYTLNLSSTNSSSLFEVFNRKKKKKKSTDSHTTLSSHLPRMTSQLLTGSL